MNDKPSWFARLPEHIAVLEDVVAERLDRQAIEQIFDLRKTAALGLLRRMGAEQCGHSLLIERPVLLERLRQLQRETSGQWEVQRRANVACAIEQSRQEQDLRQRILSVSRTQVEQQRAANLPSTIEWRPGLVSIRCRDAEDLLGQLMLLAQAFLRDGNVLQRWLEQGKHEGDWSL